WSPLGAPGIGPDAGGLVAVDVAGHDGDCLLVDAGVVPALDGGDVGFAFLVAGAGAPAVAAQEVGGGGQRVGARADQVNAAVAVAIDAELDDVLGQELRLADFAMRGTDRVGAQVTTV